MALVAQDTLDDQAEAIVAAWQELGARPVELAEEFSLRGEFGGRAVLFRPRAVQGGELDWGRMGRLDGGERVQVLNFVALPSVEVRAPIVAVEALFFGESLHLLVIDALGDGQSTRQTLRARKEAMRAEWELEGVPEWGEGAFSEDLIFLKPGKKVALGPAVVVPWIAEIAAAQVKDLQNSESCDEVERAGRWEERRRFLKVQREHEPARPFLERLTGDSALVERLLEGFLYPRGLEGVS